MACQPSFTDICRATPSRSPARHSRCFSPLQVWGSHPVAGVLGVPWFAEASYGLATATFGYHIGFIVAAFIVGARAWRGGTRNAELTFLTTLTGSAASYALGLTWLKVSTGLDWGTAFGLGVTPFLLADLLKAGLAAGILAAWALIRRRNSRRAAR